MDRKITALKAQKKNPNRVSVYLDDEYAFGLAKIVAAWLQVGQTLSDEKIAELKEQDNSEVALQKALRFLSYRPRSEAEIQKKLTDQGYTPAVIQEVLDKLRKNQLIGDSEFARTWIENRNTFRPRSHRLLTLELRQKGVAEDVIQETLADNVDEEELAYQAAIRYVRRLEGADWETFRRKLSGFLGRRGFSYGTIAPVVRRVWSETRSEGEA